MIVAALVAAATTTATGPAEAIGDGTIVDEAAGGVAVFGAVGRLTIGADDGHDLYSGSLCTATLITPTEAITAQHCLPYSKGGFEAGHGVEELSLRFGTLRWDGGTPVGVTSVRESSENYGKQNDSIMVLTLRRAITDVQPIQVAGPDDDPLWSKGRDVVALGWGTIDDTYRSAELRKADVEVADPSVTGFDQLAFQTHGMLRTRDLGRGHTRPGDSGGPIVAFDSTGKPRVIGVLWGGEPGFIFWKDKSYYMKTGVDALFGGERK